MAERGIITPIEGTETLFHNPEKAILVSDFDEIFGHGDIKSASGKNVRCGDISAL